MFLFSCDLRVTFSVYIDEKKKESVIFRKMEDLEGNATIQEFSDIELGLN